MLFQSRVWLLKQLRRAILLTPACWVLAVWPGPAHAVIRAQGRDILVLADGQRLEGEWLNSSEQDPQSYRFRTRLGIELTLGLHQVQEVEQPSAAELDYKRLLPKVPNTLEGHWSMAERCREARMDSQREFHLNRVLAFDSDHAGARRALGYSQVEGRWVHAERWMESQGYVRYKGAWRLAQEVALESAAERREGERLEWQKKITRWRSWLLKGGDRAREALAEFHAINTTAAAAPIAKLLDEREDHPDLRMLYIETLARLGWSGLPPVLLRSYMEDPDGNIQNRCLDELEKQGREHAIAFFVNTLSHKDNVAVNHAARGLARLGDESAIRPLIEALVTKHKFQINPGGGNVNVGFDGQGVNGFTAGGGGPRVEERLLRNETVLHALTVLTPDGTNFGYNLDAWKAWYVMNNTPATINLRRSR